MIIIWKLIQEGCIKLVRSLLEEYRRRSPYIAYLVRSSEMFWALSLNPHLGEKQAGAALLSRHPGEGCSQAGKWAEDELEVPHHCVREVENLKDISMED